MANLNHPAIDPGMLSAADLEDARRNNPGSIWQISPHRMLPYSADQCDHCAMRCDYCQAAEACTEVGAEVGHSAAESMWRYRRNRATVGLALTLAIAGAAVHFIWPLAV